MSSNMLQGNIPECSMCSTSSKNLHLQVIKDLQIYILTVGFQTHLLTTRTKSEGSPTSLFPHVHKGTNQNPVGSQISKYLLTTITKSEGSVTSLSLSLSTWPYFKFYQLKLELGHLSG